MNGEDCGGRVPAYTWNSLENNRVDKEDGGKDKNDRSRKEKISDKASKFARTLDTIALYGSVLEATFVDTIGMIAIGGGCLAGAAAEGVGLPAGCGAGLTYAWEIDYGITQFTLLGQAENYISGVALISTAASDAFAGNTGLSESGHLQIGRDTLVSFRNAIGGMIPEANIDLAINISQYRYDQHRLTGIKPGGSIEITGIKEVGDVITQLIWNDWY